MSQGLAGYLGLAKESTWGTAVEATDYAELNSENVRLDIDRFEIKDVIGGFYEPDDAAGINRIAGSLTLPAYPEVLGHFLRGIMGAPTTSVTVVVSGFLHTHKFLTPVADYAAGEPVPPYTFEVFRDVTSSNQYAGVNMNTLELNAQPNQALQLTAGVIGKSTSVVSKTSPTFVSSPVNPFTFDTCSLGIGGSGTALVEALTITIDNALEGIPALNASAAIARVRRTGAQTIKVAGTIDFDNLTEYDAFVNQTEQAMIANFTKADSFQLTIDMPRVVYTAFPLGMDGRGRQLVSFEGMVRYKTTSATAIEINLTTTSSGF